MTTLNTNSTNALMPSGQSAKPSEWAFKAFMALAKIYGGLWFKEHGKTPSAAFCEVFDGICSQGLARIVKAAQIALQGGNAFPPALGMITVWATQLSEDEYTDMLYRVMSSRPSNQIEEWLIAYAKRDLKLCRDGEQLKILKRKHRHAVELEKQGRLFEERQELMALPQHSVKSHIDRCKERTSINPDVRFSVMARIDRMKRAQANQPKEVI